MQGDQHSEIKLALANFRRLQTRAHPHSRTSLRLPLLQQGFLAVRQPCSVCIILVAVIPRLLTVSPRHRRTHETNQDGQPLATEEDLENEENEFGSLDDDLSSPEESHRPEGIIPALSTSMPPPSSLVMQPIPQPMVAPSQLVQPQMLQHTI